jgi:hypothetical protein
MKPITTFVLAAAAMIWLCCPGIAAAQISWSEQSYDRLASADSAASIPPAHGSRPRTGSNIRISFRLECSSCGRVNPSGICRQTQ